jgi:nucleoid-associated protein YgaU
VKYYGKGWLHPTISKANKGTNPKKLRPGVVVIIPSPPPKAAKKVKKQIAAGSGSVKTGVGSVKPQAPVAPKPPSHYVVKKGDTLSAISERLLGSSRYTNKFYEVNKSLGLEYTELHVGTRLRVPKL